MNNIIAGADDVEGAALLQKNLTVLNTAGFEAHKWCSNRKETLEEVPAHLREKVSQLSIGANNIIKMFGLEWNHTDDQFQFFVRRTEAANTKREILSAISKFFDPLGVVGLIITMAKLIMQETWRIDCE